MILQSARFPHFCHHQLRLAFDYTPMHQDDQGQFSSRSKNRTEEREGTGVAAVVSIARGPGASYPFKTIGADLGQLQMQLDSAQLEARWANRRDR
jgi:hypothetical protein